MRYDFDSFTDRKGTYALKWDVRKGELPMWVADMDFNTAPAVTEALVMRAWHGIYGYTTIPDKWYDAYINWWKDRHNVEYKRQELLFSTGVIPTISSCIRKLTTPGENVLIMTPVYNIFYNCIRNNGRNVLEVPLVYEKDSCFPDWAALEKALSDPQTALMLLCNPHNPVGRIWNRQELERIGELAEKYGVTVLSDEIHCDITDPGKDYVPYASVSEKCRKNCIICVSPTKAFNLAGIQTSAVIIPDVRLRHKVWRALNTDEVAEPNVFAVDAAVAAFTKGGDWLDELREYLLRNKKRTAEFLEKEIPAVKLMPSEATYLLWLDCSGIGLTSSELAKRIRQKTGLYLSDGRQYGERGCFLRMNIACPASLLEDGLRRLKKAVDAIML